MSLGFDTMALAADDTALISLEGRLSFRLFHSLLAWQKAICLPFGLCKEMTVASKNVWINNQSINDEITDE